MAQPLLARALACVALAALAPAQESDWAAQANAALAKFERGARCEEQAIVLLETAPGDEASRATALGLLLALADAAVQLREADEGLASQLDALATKEWIPPPAQARLCYASGEIRFRIGSLEAADKSLADAMRFDPTLTLHLANRRCFVQIARGDMVTALAMSEIAREASTSELDRRRTSQTRADLALRIGLFDEAARSLAAARGPETGEDYDALAELRIEAELALALEDFERANEVAARWRDRAITAGDHGIASLQRATIALLRAKAALEGPQRALMDAQRILDDASWPAANRASASHYHRIAVATWPARRGAVAGAAAHGRTRIRCAVTRRSRDRRGGDAHGLIACWRTSHCVARRARCRVERANRSMESARRTHRTSRVPATARATRPR
jgi:hypothetical protein